MKQYLTDRFIPDQDKASGFSRYEGPIIDAVDIEHAKSQAESYGCVVVGVLVWEGDIEDFERLKLENETN